MMLLILVSCRNRTEQWLDNMAGFQSLKGKTLSLDIMKVKPAKEDTTEIMYKVRLYPDKAWLENATGKQKESLSYSMDSCFSLRAGTVKYMPDMMQPVSNGVAGCQEYLLSFGVEAAMKYKKLQLVYNDRYIDGKTYQIILNK